MADHLSTATAKLEELIEEFAEMEVRERLEYLLEFADQFPELPERYRQQRDAEEHRVHECQTPVFLWVELNGDQVQIFADVPPNSPTVRGLIGLVISTFSGARPAEVLAIRPNLLQQLGLVQALGMVRMRGLNGILQRVRQEVGRAMTHDP